MNKVSIIVPVYNVEMHIEKCLEQVLCQTFKDIEYILVDDCGTDRSMDIVREYISGHPREKDIRIIACDQNRGVGFARDEGVRHATGEYIFFSDSDDTIEPDCIEKLYQAMEQNDVDFVVASYDKIDFHSGQLLEKVVLEDGRIEGQPAIVEAFYKKKYPLMVWNKLIKTSFLRENHIECSLFRYEDDVFNFQMICHANSCVTLSNISYHYYIRENSVTFRREYDDRYFTFQLEMTNQSRKHALEFRNQAMYPYLSRQLFWQRVFVAKTLLYNPISKVKNQVEFLHTLLRSDVSLKEVSAFKSYKMTNYLMALMALMPVWGKKIILWILKKIE